MKKAHSILSALRIVLLTFFLGHYANITLFYHTHEVDGKMYCHSHFSGDAGKSSPKIPLPKHTHSTTAFQLIQLFNETCYVNDFVEPHTGYFEQNPVEIKQKLPVSPAISSFHPIVSLRAPPVV